MAYEEISLIDEYKVKKETEPLVTELNENTRRIIREFKAISESHGLLISRIEVLEKERETLKERIAALEAGN